MCDAGRKRTHLGNEGTVDLLQDVVHLQQLGSDERAVGPADVADVVQAQVVEDQHVPVVSLQGAVQVAGHVVVHLNRNNRDTKRRRSTFSPEVGDATHVKI